LVLCKSGVFEIFEVDQEAKVWIQVVEVLGSIVGDIILWFLVCGELGESSFFIGCPLSKGDAEVVQKGDCLIDLLLFLIVEEVLSDVSELWMDQLKEVAGHIMQELRFRVVLDCLE